MCGIHRSQSTGAAGAERARGGGGGRGLSGVTEGGVALERRVEVGQAEKLGLDPMNDQEGSCPMCFQKGPPGVPRGA